MYVITGGAGFLGSNLAAGIEERGLGEITIVDRFQTDDRWRNIAKRSLRDIVFPEKFLNISMRMPAGSTRCCISTTRDLRRKTTLTP